AEATGHLALGTTLATAIGPALGLFLAGSIGYAWLFRATLGITVVSLVLGLLVREAPAAADVDGERAAGEVPLEHPAPA
ncbi:hypothetical protein QR510_30965, partial [Escherichia coli]